MQKNFYKDASTNAHAIFMLCAVVMIGLSIYLTSHYFEARYPEGLGSASLCDISSFFSCDITTFSHASNIFGVPVSIFGGLVGVLLLFGYMFKSDLIDGTNHFMLIANAIGCVFFFSFSLFFLGGLCPFCTLYYLFSFAALFIYMRNSDNRRPSLKIIASYVAVFLAVSGAAYAVVSGKEASMSKTADQLIKLYDDIPKVGHPTVEAPYYLVKNDSAPLTITKFSDFQCPACKALSTAFQKVVKRYAGKITIQYMFYPLDNSCNPNMTRPLHDMACEASYLAACMPDKFAQVEHDLFANQKSLSKKWITDYAKAEGVYDCYTSEETKKKVLDIINAATPYQIQGTPTIILNGAKIDRLPPLKNLYMLLDKLLERAN